MLATWLRFADRLIVLHAVDQVFNTFDTLINHFILIGDIRRMSLHLNSLPLIRWLARIRSCSCRSCVRLSSICLFIIPHLISLERIRLHFLFLFIELLGEHQNLLIDLLLIAHLGHWSIGVLILVLVLVRQVLMGDLRIILHLLRMLLGR